MVLHPRRCTSRITAPLKQRAQIRVQRRGYAAIAESFQPGDKLHGFTLRRVKHIPELELTALHLQHDKTGAEHLHIAREDKNNVFAIGFKTNPPDHTGVPHILEHLVLCGSEKYPVRDPFFKMMPRSLQNFMNAFTSQDHTTYPFATTNPQDFKNLMSVYMDATLHPLLKAHDFTQEGWRVGPADVPRSLEDAKKDVPESDLVFKGVVYNEMKGAMSSGDMLFAIRHRDHLFPAINNSGGIPQEMTNLTHEQLKAFHAAHYNPSNALLFTYGNMILTEHLKEIGPQLDRFEKRSIDKSQRIPIDLVEDMEPVTVNGPLDPNFPQDQQHKASVSWLMCDTSDVLETFSLGMIASLLLDGFSAPVYQNTIEVGWGASYSSNTGLDTSGKIATFSVGLNGLKKHDVPRLQNGLRNTFLAVKRKGGFDRNKIEGRLHQIELDLKHKSAQFGMGLMSSLTESFFKGADPLAAVAAEETLAAFRAKLQEPRYLEDLFEKYFLTNKTLTFVMEPTEDFEQGLMAEEAERLAAKISDITSRHPTPEEARKSMAMQEYELQEYQETAKKEDISCLPTVHVSDITRQVDRKEVRHSSVAGTKVQWREAPTNGLTYFRGILSLKDLPDDLRLYLPLFSAAIHRLGTTSLSTEALEDAIKLKTGGVGVGYHTSTSAVDLDVCEEGISFSSHALDRNVPDMFNLLRMLIEEANFDRPDAEEKIAEIIKSSASSAMDDIADMGHVYARRFAEAGLTPAARMNEEVSGLTQTRLTVDLASRGSNSGLSDVMDKLRAIQFFALSGGPSLRCAITCGPESSSANEEALASFLSGLPQDVTAPSSLEQATYPRNVKSFFPLPYQVYYTALALRTVPLVSPASAPLQILAQLLTHKHIHHEIREKGGAYGGSASMSSSRGTFAFTSYRDPNPLNSLEVMRGAGKWARDRKWTERELEEAKLSVFQSMDAPKSVDEEGMLQFLTGIDENMEQELRERLLDVKPAQVNEVADEYIVKGLEWGNGSTAVLGKEQDWASQQKGWIHMPMAAGEQPTEESPDDGYAVI